MGKFLKRAEATVDGVGEVGSGLDTLAGQYPALTEFLALDKWEDGAPRETGTVLLCTGDGRWRACLNDRDALRSAWLSSPTLAGLLDALEGVLRTGRAEWRAARQWKGGKGGRKGG